MVDAGRSERSTSGGHGPAAVAEVGGEPAVGVGGITSGGVWTATCSDSTRVRTTALLDGHGERRRGDEDHDPAGSLGGGHLVQTQVQPVWRWQPVQQYV